MKKILTLLGIILLSTSLVNAKELQNNDYNRPVPPPKMSEAERAQKEADFEKRLGLTEEQKIQAKELRKQGFEKIKPVIDKIRIRHQEADTVRQSGISEEAKQEKLEKIRTDIQALNKQAREIQKENMKAFEAILTSEQKKTLEEMKKEGRQKYHKNHPPQFRAVGNKTR